MRNAGGGKFADEAGLWLVNGERGRGKWVLRMPGDEVDAIAAGMATLDGFSIGSDDLTQLALGVDRESDDLAEQFDARDPAVIWLTARMIAEARSAGAKIGLRGQAPSDHPDFAAFLVGCGIDSISVTPDSFVRVKRTVAEAEAAPPHGGASQN